MCSGRCGVPTSPNPLSANETLVSQPVEAGAGVLDVAAVLGFRGVGGQSRRWQVGLGELPGLLLGERGQSTRPGDRPARRPRWSCPDVTWVSGRNHTRAPGDLEDQAARYHAPSATSSRSTPTCACSPTWRAGGSVSTKVFRAPAARSSRSYGEWFEQTLVEVVLSARGFGRSPHWDSAELADLLSPAAAHRGGAASPARGRSRSASPRSGR